MSILAENIEEAPVATTMYAVIKVKESVNEQWKETAEVVSSSSTGAGFYIGRECHVGRLVSIMLPLPPEFRRYDHAKELYQIWGVVQHCHMRPPEEMTGYHVGVAFIGKHAPDSYKKNPMQNYRICGMSEGGLWKVAESVKEFKPRKGPRFYHPVNHYLAIVNGRGHSLSGEWAVTENISKNGAAVVSALDLHVGDQVKFISEKFDFSGLAVVCGRQDTDNGRARLSLHFVENNFPIRQIALPKQVFSRRMNNRSEDAVKSLTKT